MMDFIKLGFMGSYKVDFLCYFSKILLALGKKVVVVDASKEQYLKYTIPSIDDQEITTYQQIDFMLNRGFLEKLDAINYEAYDIALIDYGFNKEVCYDFLSCHILFVVTDFERHNVYQMKDLMQFAFTDRFNVVKIYRDVIPSKINSKYIDHLLLMEEKVKVLAEYIFLLNEADMRCKLSCQYDDYFNLKTLSKAHKGLFKDIIEEIYGINTSEITRAIKWAEEAKVCK